MTATSWIKAVSATLSLTSLALLLLTVGRFAVAFYALPIPALSWNNSGRLISSLNSGGESGGQPVLKIGKVGIQTPILVDISPSDQNLYLPALEKGVALAAGSAPLGADQGNSFIFGHSSALTLHPSPADLVFARLPQLKEGDTFSITSDAVATAYRVVASHPVQPDEVSYMAQSSDRRVTLATCYPLGSNAMRWIVQGVRIP